LSAPRSGLCLFLALLDVSLNARGRRAMFLPKLPPDSLASSAGPFYPNRPAPSFYRPLCAGVEITRLDRDRVYCRARRNRRRRGCHPEERGRRLLLPSPVVCPSTRRCLLPRCSLHEGRHLEERYRAKSARPTRINSPTRDVRVS